MTMKEIRDLTNDAGDVVIADDGMFWRPIAELEDRYADNLLLCAPELVDLNCNPHGIGMGFWQDDRDLPGMTLAEFRGEVPVTSHDPARRAAGGYDGFLACRWNLSNDEWESVPVTPTHFLILQAP